eukprot:s870_g15.t1
MAQVIYPLETSDLDVVEGAASDELKSKYAAQDGDRGLLVAAPAPLGADLAEPPVVKSVASSGPSWEELKAKEKKKEFMQSQLFIDGCYTPLAIERLCEEIADSGGVDLLLTSEWPKGVMSTLKDAWPEEAEVRKLAKGAARQCSSAAVAELAVAAEPKYHAVGLGGVFWRRQPWRHERRGEASSWSHDKGWPCVFTSNAQAVNCTPATLYVGCECLY